MRMRQRSSTGAVVVAAACALVGVTAGHAAAAPPRIAVKDVRITEPDTGTRKVTFTLTRTTPRAAVSRVRFASLDGTARKGADYTAKTGTATFRAGAVKTTVTVLVRGDLLNEPNETFFLVLSRPTGARIADARAKATIVDDDPPQVVRFVTMGATGKGNQAQLDIAEAIAAKCAAEGCDFVQGLGNNIYDSGASSVDDAAFDTRFQTPYAGVALPFWMILGNHDYGGGGAGYELNKAQVQVDYTAEQTKWKMPAHYYRHREEHVEFFALDTTMQMFGASTDAAHQAALTQQRATVANWLATSTATWKIAVGLHSYRSNGNHGNAGAYEQLPFIPITNGQSIEDFMEDIVCGKADLSLSAHDHTLQWLKQDADCLGTELVVAGTGSSTTALEDENRNPAWFQQATLGFAYVVVEDRTLTLEFVGVNGDTVTSLFTKTITKP
jgi:hypothetical protein